MRAVIQRVLSANVSVVDGGSVSSIGHGLCVLVGISRHDTKKDLEYIVRKILNTRIFDDDSGKRWSRSVKDCNGEILCVSQVTLYHTFKGNKLDFHNAMSPDPGQKFYYDFLDFLKSQYNPDRVKDGKFGAHMVVNIQNDGPVTIVVESPTELSKDVESGPDVESSSAQTTKSGAPDVESSSSQTTKSGSAIASSSSQTTKSGQPNLESSFSQTTKSGQPNFESSSSQTTKSGPGMTSSSSQTIKSGPPPDVSSSSSQTTKSGGPDVTSSSSQTAKMGQQSTSSSSQTSAK